MLFSKNNYFPYGAYTRKMTCNATKVEMLADEYASQALSVNY